METWDNQDVNNPELYRPRTYPKVKQAPLRIHSDRGEFALPPSFSARAGGKGQRGPISLAAAVPGAYGPRAGAGLRGGAGPAAGGSVSRADARGDFLFDEDWSWGMSLAAIPEQMRQPVRGAKENGPASKAPGKKPSGKGPGSKGNDPGGKDPGKTGFFSSPYWYAGVITVCVAALAFIAVMMMPQVVGYFWKDVGNYAFINGEVLRYDRQIAQNYKQSRDYLQQDVIYPGVFVDGHHVGGMTIQQAQAALAGADVTPQNLFSVNVTIGNKTWTFDGSNVPASRDLGNVLHQAYAVGRTNTTDPLGTHITPFRERLSTVMALREAGVNLSVKAAYDHETVRKLVEDIAAFVTREPKDAALQSIDISTHTLLFADEQVGVTIDAQELYQKVTASLDNGEKGTTITVEPILTQPKVTKAQLSANFRRIAAYTTDTTKDSNRNNNIDLACQAITSTVLMPGETFSFNAATGQRTIEKGYREAGAIAAGQSIEEVGGGICQVSSTLFNAVARADLEIVSRSPHAWPSTYVNRGEDATVNWPNLDFQFRNNKDTPVYVVAYYQNRKCSAEIWGFPLGEDVTIDLKSTVVKTMEPPLDVRYVPNPNMTPGTSKETIKSRTGYVVDTYKIWYQSGTEIKREKLHTSTYKAYQRTIEYN